jgi:hypothetical protein
MNGVWFKKYAVHRIYVATDIPDYLFNDIIDINCTKNIQFFAFLPCTLVVWMKEKADQIYACTDTQCLTKKKKK